MKSIEQMILDSNYYIDLLRYKRTTIFNFPPNTKLKLNKLSVFYTLKDYGLLITDYSKRHVECPDYARKSIICTDLLFQCNKRKIGMDIIFSKNKNITVSEIYLSENKLEEKLLDCIIRFLDIGDQEVDDDILDGYNSVINFISGMIC